MLGKLRSLPGCVGWIVLDADGHQLGEWNAGEQFPLACAAKLAIGAAMVAKVEARELTWDTQISDLVFDPRQWNMTGGLPHALIDVGLLGDSASGEYILYGLAAKDLSDRALSAVMDQSLADVLRELYRGLELGGGTD